jgi:hypothetical protein
VGFASVLHNHTTFMFEGVRYVTAFLARTNAASRRRIQRSITGVDQRLIQELKLNSLPHIVARGMISAAVVVMASSSQKP